MKAGVIFWPLEALGVSIGIMAGLGRRLDRFA